MARKYRMASYVDLLSISRCFPTLLCKSKSADGESKATIKVALNTQSGIR